MGNIFMRRISGFFKRSGMDALLLHNGDLARGCDPNFYYFTGTRIDNSLALLTPDSATLFCSKMNLDEARETAWMASEEAGEGVFSKIRKRAGKGKIGVDFDSISASRYLRWKRKLGKIFNAKERIGGLRAVKGKEEIAAISKAVGIGKGILGDIGGELAPGMTELEVAKMLKNSAAEQNVEVSFEPIVAAGGAARFPHYKPKCRKLGKQMVLVDFGVRLGGYCSDNTR